ncbi:tyrosyl-DNA phosphodiesterase 2 [Calypte anna]|uniref:tyrosyl-DNA phosphodiesterase 2 n=1 Tax=Calypte anna TaxID=9244 RepID=UPI0011C3A9F2|nr:tyrosyl-DNA phosphodiesterase 2 [Calypte anna]XP_030301736.1 tyrosyl-DNA phosphodiesterase 2 [Calypte anna]
MEPGVRLEEGEALRCPQAGDPLPEEEEPEQPEQQREGEEREEEEEDDDDDEASHRAKRRKVLCSEFAAITCSDVAVARSFLAGNDWQMEMALNAYFEVPVEKEAKKEEKEAEGGILPASAEPGTCIDLTADATTSNSSGNSMDPKQQEDDSRFSLLTWNIDGLDIGNLKERAKGICSYLTLYNPDVVFLQEVVPPHLCLLQMKASSYTIIPGNIDGYFTAIMLKKTRVKLLKHEIIPFPTTSMMRNLLVAHVSISGNELCLMTSHLESTKDHSKERVKQLQIVFNEMQKESESTTVIFGGDTNLRDSEVTKLGSLPKNVVDIWEFLGKPQHCRYTWDTHSNTNLDAPYKCKMRFDRIYFRPAAGEGHIIPRSMDLIGLEKLDCGRFPSDHWGLLCNFDVIL